MFEFNGKNIKLEFDYNTMCELEDMGVSIADMDKKPLRLIRTIIYLALKKVTPTITIEEAGKEIATFLGNGGSLETVGEAISKGIEESGFFPKNNK